MPTIRVRITATGQVLTLDIEDYLRCVVPNESPASWPMEELKAQAVAARTYALAQGSVILADDERSQVYRPGSATAHTDEAVRATAGVVGTYQGVIRPMYFSASCGGQTLSNWGPWLKPTACPCAGAGYGVNGHRQGLCQQGARVLAQQGRSYTEILNHYYNMQYVQPVSSKLAVHWQTTPTWANQIHTPWHFVMDPGRDNLWPGSQAAGRLWLDFDNTINSTYVARGAVGAEAYFQRCLPKFRESPWIKVWQGPNEPQPMSDLNFVKAFAAFDSRMIDLMHGVGLLYCSGTFGVTWPRVEQIMLFRESMLKADYMSMHLYSAPTMQSNNQADFALHHRPIIAKLRAEGVRVPPILVTEAGLDGGCAGQDGCGWKAITPSVSREQYQAQLAWFDTELCKDPDIIAVCIFTGGPKPDWITFEVDEVLARWIMGRHSIQGGSVLETFLGAEAQKTIIPLNPNSAFEKYATPRGWLPAGTCPDVRFNGVLYSVQPYRWSGDRAVQYIVYCITGDWGNVKHFLRQN